MKMQIIFYNNLTYFRQGFYFYIFGSLQFLALSLVYCFYLRKWEISFTTWFEIHQPPVFLTRILKDSMACNSLRMSILLDSNSCVRATSSTFLVSTETNCKVESNVKKCETLTNVSILHLLSLSSFIFFSNKRLWQ